MSGDSRLKWATIKFSSSVSALLLEEVGLTRNHKVKWNILEDGSAPKIVKEEKDKRTVRVCSVGILYIRKMIGEDFASIVSKYL